MSYDVYVFYITEDSHFYATRNYKKQTDITIL